MIRAGEVPEGIGSLGRAGQKNEVLTILPGNIFAKGTQAAARDVEVAGVLLPIVV
jgi:hypothetical protein